MNEGAAQSTLAAVPHRRDRMFAGLRLVLEFAILFTLTLIAKELLASTVTATYPNLLWLPIAALTLQNGLACGLTAAIIATALQYVTGLPAELMGEDIYSYIARVAAEPIAWTSFALIFGHIRTRQIAHAAELEAQLAERNVQCAAVAELCDDLRRRIELLERQIAAAAQASNTDMAQALIELHHAGWDEFADRLRSFIVLMTGCPEFSIHLLGEDALTLTLPPGDDHRPGAGRSILRGDALFGAIVEERRILSARHPADAAVLAARALMAGPISAGKDPKAVLGMLSISGASPDDCSDDLERRFSLALSEVSRFSAQLSLVERWQAATTAANGQGRAEQTEIELPQRKPAPLKGAVADREAMLQ